MFEGLNDANPLIRVLAQTFLDEFLGRLRDDLFFRKMNVLLYNL